MAGILVVAKPSARAALRADPRPVVDPADAG
jgi:hypothetical protein